MARRSTQLLNQLKGQGFQQRPEPGLEQLVRTVAPSSRFPKVYVILDSSYLARMSDQDIRNLQTSYTQEGQEVRYIITSDVQDEITHQSSQNGGAQTSTLMTQRLRNYLTKTLKLAIMDVPEVHPQTEELIRQTCSQYCRKQRKFDIEGGQNGDNIEPTDIGIIGLAMQLQKNKGFENFAIAGFKRSPGSQGLSERLKMSFRI